MAAVKPKTFGGYLRGCRELEQFGRIDDPEIMESYLEDALMLTRQVLAACKVIHCPIPTYTLDDDKKKLTHILSIGLLLYGRYMSEPNVLCRG